MAKNKKRREHDRPLQPANGVAKEDPDDHCETIPGEVQLFPVTQMIPLETPEPIPARRTKRSPNLRNGGR